MKDRLSGEEDPDNPSFSGRAGEPLAAGHLYLITAERECPLPGQVGRHPLSTRLTSAVIEYRLGYVDHFTPLQ